MQALAKKTKKKTKNELFTEIAKGIMSKSGDIRENYAEYLKFLQTQTILKKLPKGIKNKAWKYVIPRIYREYVAVNPHPRYECEYLEGFANEVRRFVDYWNYHVNNAVHIFENETFSPISIYQRKLKKKFRELNPRMAEADALFMCSMQLYKKAGLTNPAIDTRLAELTNNFDLEIMANLPSLADYCERRLFTGERDKNVPILQKSLRVPKPAKQILQ